MLSAELTDAALFGLGGRHGDLSMHIAVDLRRAFSREELVEALRATIAAFPVLGGRYRPGLWRDRWVDVTAPVEASVHVVPTAEGDDEAVTADWVRRPIVATRDRPIRLVGLVRGNGMRLILSLLHIVGDGASIAAISHVLGSHLRGGPPVIPVDANRHPVRALDGLRWLHLPLLAGAVTRSMLDPLFQLAAARRRRGYRVDPSARAAWSRIIITKEELDQLRSRCEGSVNDLLIAALARVAGDRSSDGPVAVTYTMDLRRYAKKARLTATNSSSLLTAIVPRRALKDLPSAARATSAITSHQRRRLAGPAFMLAPHVFLAGVPHAALRGLVPLVAPILVDLPLSRGLLMTNVGRIDDAVGVFGDDVEDVRVIGPFAERIPIPVIVALGYRGELHLEVFTPAGLAHAAGEDLERNLLDALDLRGSRSGGREA